MFIFQAGVNSAGGAPTRRRQTPLAYQHRGVEAEGEGFRMTQPRVLSKLVSAASRSRVGGDGVLWGAAPVSTHASRGGR